MLLKHEKIYTVYAERDDITYIMKSIYNNYDELTFDI